MSYTLFLEKQVIKFLSKLDNQTKNRIFTKLEELEINPIPMDAKRIVNSKEKVFRIRIGDYRALYRLEKNKIIIVFLIDKRSRVYNHKI